MKTPSIQYKGKLTETKAIKLSLEIWTWLAETGKLKPLKYSNKFYCGCPLCEYHNLSKNGYCISDCPLSTMNYCTPHYHLWFNAVTNDQRKIYAIKIRNILQKSFNKIK